MEKRKAEGNVLVKSVAWNTWGNLLYFGVQWALTVLVARILGYESAGILSLSMSITNIFAALSNYGIRNYQISDIEGKYSAGSYIVSRIIAESVALLLCVLFVVYNHYNIYVSLCIIVYMIFRLSETCFEMFSSIYQLKWRVDYLGKSLTYRSLIMCSIFFIVIFLKKDLLLYIVCIAITTQMFVLIYDGKNAKKLEDIKLKNQGKDARRILVECFPLAIYSVISAAIASVPRYFLEKLLGTELLGIYASVAAPTLIVQLLASNIFSPMLTSFAEMLSSGKKEAFQKLFYKCIVSIFGISLASIVLADLLGRWGLVLLFGKEMGRYEFLLLPLLFCTITTAILWFGSGMLIVIRKLKAVIYGNALAFILSSALSIIMIKKLGAQGASYALLIGNVVGCIFVFYCFAQNMKEYKNEK